MTERHINPSKITKPIQLLAAWLAGLILIDGSFLTAATQLSKPEWVSEFLVVAAVANVPIFLVCLFMLQTKFRPEMQEDEFYARYLEKRYSAETADTEMVELSAGPLSRSEAIAKIEKAEPIVSTPKVISSNRATSTQIEFNTLLPNSEQLKAEMLAGGLGPINDFDNQRLGPPSPFIVTIGGHTEVEIFQRIVSIAKKYGLEGVGYAPQDVSNGRIYVGSYAYIQRPYVRLTPGLIRRLVRPNLSWDQLQKLLKGEPSTLVAPSKKSPDSSLLD